MNHLKALFAQRTAREICDIVAKGMTEQGFDLQKIEAKTIVEIGRQMAEKATPTRPDFIREWQDDGVFAIAVTREWEKRRKNDRTAGVDRASER